MSFPTTPLARSERLLQRSADAWFAVVVIGQLIFAFYIFGLYGVSGLAGDFERWNAASTHGYVSGDVAGNLFFGLHVALAAIVTLGGPLQLMRPVRSRLPKFHRINGRVYLSAALLISLAGFYLTWVRGTVGGVKGALFVSANGVLILVCAYQTLQKAVSRAFEDHRRWAVRLFLAMSGVWFFRVFLMLWLVVNQGPAGFDMDTFEGPALDVLNAVSYVLPVFLVGWYFRAKATREPRGKRVLAVFVLVLTLGIAIGTFAATMGMWLPNLG